MRRQCRPSRVRLEPYLHRFALSRDTIFLHRLLDEVRRVPVGHLCSERGRGITVKNVDFKLSIYMYLWKKMKKHKDNLLVAKHTIPRRSLPLP